MCRRSIGIRMVSRPKEGNLRAAATLEASRKLLEKPWSHLMSTSEHRCPGGRKSPSRLASSSALVRCPVRLIFLRARYRSQGNLIAFGFVLQGRLWDRTSIRGSFDDTCRAYCWLVTFMRCFLERYSGGIHRAIPKWHYGGELLHLGALRDVPADRLRDYSGRGNCSWCCSFDSEAIGSIAR